MACRRRTESPTLPRYAVVFGGGVVVRVVVFGAANVFFVSGVVCGVVGVGFVVVGGVAVGTVAVGALRLVLLPLEVLGAIFEGVAFVLVVVVVAIPARVDIAFGEYGSAGLAEIIAQFTGALVFAKEMGTVVAVRHTQKDHQESICPHGGRSSPAHFPRTVATLKNRMYVEYRQNIAFQVLAPFLRFVFRSLFSPQMGRQSTGSRSSFGSIHSDTSSKTVRKRVVPTARGLTSVSLRINSSHARAR